MAEERLSSSVFEELISGTKKFNDNTEFRNAIKDSPDDPWFYRLLAGHHQRKKSFIEAEKTYLKSYQLFMAQGKCLQAIASLLRSWAIIRPTSRSYRTLHSQLRRQPSHTSAIAECLAKMSYPELKSVLQKSKLVKYSARQVVRKAGEADDALFVVVYGRLVSTAPDDNGPQHDSHALILKGDDIFGDRHPGTTEKSRSNLIKTLTEAEVLKISKADLLSLCGDHPDLQIGLKAFQEDLALDANDRPTKFFRKTSRRKLISTMMLEIFAREPGKFPFVVKCYTSDISLGGACVIVDPRYRDLPIADLVNRKARLNISLPDESISLTILGRLAWYKETDLNGNDTYAIGVQFNEMPPRLRGLLIVFANAVGSISHTMEEEQPQSPAA